MTDSTIDGKPNERALDHAPDLDEWFGDLERPADDGDAGEQSESERHWGKEVEDTTAADVFERIRSETADAGTGAGEILADETPEDIIASADEPDDREAIDEDLFDEGALDDLLLTGRTEAQGFLWIETETDEGSDGGSSDAADTTDSMAEFYERAGIAPGDGTATESADGNADVETSGSETGTVTAGASGTAETTPSTETAEATATTDTTVDEGGANADSMAEFYERAGMEPPGSDSSAEEPADAGEGGDGLDVDADDDPTTTLDDLYERAGMSPPSERASDGDDSTANAASESADADSSQTDDTDADDGANDEDEPSESLADLYERAGIPLEGSDDTEDGDDEAEDGAANAETDSDASDATAADASSTAGSNDTATTDSAASAATAETSDGGSRTGATKSKKRRSNRSSRNRRSRDEDDEEWEGLFNWLGQRVGKYL